MNDSFTLLAGWMIDGTGASARRHVLVRVDKGRICSVEDAGAGKLDGAAGLKFHDLSACTLVPGLIDCHVHLTLSGTVDPKIRGEQLNYSFQQNRSLLCERMRKYLARGIMALRDGGDRDGHGLRYRKERASDNSRPVFKAAGTGWRAKGRYGKLIANRVDEDSSIAECILRHDPSADHIKIVNSGLNSLTEFGRQTPPQFAREELAAAIAAARRRGMKTMVHANGYLPVADAIDAGCTSIEHGFFMGLENMEKMAERAIFWVPTAYSMRSFCLHTPPDSIEAQIAARNLDHQLEQISRAREKGVRIALGSDSGGYGLFHGEAFIEELKILMEAGFTTEQAIHSASLEGAGLLGLEDEIGPIKAGMPATFLAAPGPPSQLPDSLRKVESMYIRGVKVK